MQDSLGFVWIGSEYGISRFDGIDFDAFRPAADHPGGIPPDDIFAIAEERSGHLWLGLKQEGLIFFDAIHETVQLFQYSDTDPHTLSHNAVRCLLKTTPGIWIGTVNGLNLMERVAGKVQFTRFLLDLEILCLLQWNENTLLAGTNHGLFEINLTTLEMKKWKEFPRQDQKVAALSIMPDQRIALGIQGEGIFQLNMETQAWTAIKDCHRLHFQALSYGLGNRLWATGDWGIGHWNPENGRWQEIEGLSTERAYALFHDRYGNLFAGTDNFVYRIRLETKGIVHTPPEYVKRIALSRTYRMTAQNRIWVAAEKEVMVFDSVHSRENISYQEFELPEIKQIQGAFSLCEEPDKGLWLGTTQQGLVLYDGEKVRFFFDRSSADSVVSKYRVADILIDQTNRFWLGSWGGGLFQVVRDGKGDPESLIRYTHNPADSLSLPHNTVRCIIEDGKGRIWIGTGGGGLARFYPEKGTFKRYLQKNPHTGMEQVIEVIHIIEDPRDHSLWLGTDIGLVHIEVDSDEKITVFTQKDGLPGDNVATLTMDQHYRLWLGIYGGICSFDPLSRQVLRYPELPATEMCGHGAYTDPEGTVYFAAIEHNMGFHPDSFHIDINPPEIRLTRLSMLGEEVTVSQAKKDGSFLLKKALPYLSEMQFPYNQKIIQISFAGLGKGNLISVRYEYQLEGLAPSWIQLDPGQRTISLNGLAPGTYTLHLRASNAYGIWAKSTYDWPITILPPWYRTIWAYLVYLLLALAIVWTIYQTWRERVQMRNQLEREKFEKDQLAKVDQLKSRFFSNISHEFRTPLTLILGPVKQLLDQPERPEEERILLAMMHRNGNRLRDLINQILDINQLESHQMPLKTEAGNLLQHFRYLAAAFESLAYQKNLNYQYIIPEQTLHFFYDRDKLEKIVNNLLSNAFKFTPSGGSIRFTATEIPQHNQQHSQWVIQVTDTGSGIADDQLQRIFDRYYQVDDSATRRQEGSGIGLTLTKELVELMGGEIVVESKSGNGTIFTVRLPLEQAPPEAMEVPLAEELEMAPVTLSNSESVNPEAQEAEKPMILIVEDHPDMRQFIQSGLSDFYQITTASNGREGLSIASKTIPDLVISDVMMPEMDGFEFCHKLKQQETTSHIPVVMLTARVGVDSIVEGYDTGADAYLTKPFESRELKAVVDNLILQRQKLREAFGKVTKVEPGKMNITPVDVQFLQRVQEYLEVKYADSGLSAESFAEAMNMSRMQLHRKLKALLDQSAGDLIRSFRLGKAKYLLEQSGFTVAEIAFQVGFEDPGYFGRVFKTQMGETPASYAEKFQQ
ncbi:MAG: ATP-binding protein [Bacteroidia bacterium]